MPKAFSNYVGGEWVDSESGNIFEVTNPARNQETLAHYQQSTAEDTEAAIETATQAQAAWAETPGPERGTMLTRVASALENRQQETTTTLVKEEGKTRSEASGEVQRAIDIFYYYAQKASDIGGTSKASSGISQNLYTKQEPLGTVGLITPWNYPIAILAWKLAPALAAGNTVVSKPASVAPGVARILFECLDEADIPDGVANMITGPGRAVGETIASNSDIDGISFTGSTTVGTQVAETAANDLKRVQCEMGGKNPTIVMPSADIEEAVDIVGVGGFGTTGQSCTACSRAIVHEEIYDDFLDSLIDYAESLEVGPGMEDPGMGPHVTQDELASTLEYVDVGRNEGATLETGGHRLTEGVYDEGFYVAPTVFSDVGNDMAIAQEEIFGPVISVIQVADFGEALEAANDSDYGLSASIVTDHHTEANRFIDEIEAGVAKVNEKTTGLELHVPFGGYKQSSTNTYREQGDAGIDFFTATKTVYDNY